jgi:hypothetical protein
LGKRIKAGAIAQVVPDKNSKQGKYFWTLSLKGDLPISDQAKTNAAKHGGTTGRQSVSGGAALGADGKP